MAKPLTLKNVIERSRDLFEVEWDFSRAHYENRKSILLIRCPVHDIWFEQPAHSHLKGRIGCADCHTEIKAKKGKRGKPLVVDGREYISTPAAAREFGIRERVFYGRIRDGWTPEQAAELELPPPNAHAKRNLTVDGVTYRNFAELGKRYDIKGSLVRQRVASDWTLRQAVGLDPPPEKLGKKQPITFRGIEYRNSASLARAFDADPVTFGSRKRAGLTIEQALGLEDPPRKRSWRRNAEVIAGRPYPRGSAGQFLLYLVTCNPTGREYVGITTGSIEKRWGEHISNASSNDSSSIKLYRSIRKHGPDAFDIKLLRDDASNYKELLEQEMEEVARRDTFKRGLNSTPGGETVASARSIEIEGRTFPTLTSAATNYGVDESVLRSRIDTLGWTLKQALEIDPRPTDWGPKAVNLEGVDYPTIKEACKAYGISNQKVNLRMKRYGWTLEQAFELEQNDRPPGAPKKIKFQGKEYSSRTSLARQYGIDLSKFSRRLQKGWNIEQVLSLEDKPARAAHNAIEVGFKGKTYPSLKVLAKEFKVGYKLLSARLKKGWSMEEALSLKPRSRQKPRG